MQELLNDQKLRDKIKITDTYMSIYREIKANRELWKKTTKIYMYQSQTLNFLGRAGKKLNNTKVEDADQVRRLEFMGSLTFDRVDASRILRSLRKRSSKVNKEQQLLDWRKKLKDIAVKWVQIINNVNAGFGGFSDKLQSMAATLQMVKRFCNYNLSLQGELQKIINSQINDLKNKTFLVEEKTGSPK